MQFAGRETANWEVTGTPRILQDAERRGLMPGRVSMRRPMRVCLWVSLGTEPRVSHMLNESSAT